ETFSSLSSNYRTALQKFFEWGGGHLYVNDPGGQSGLLNSYLTWSQEEDVKQSFKTASDRALRALEAEQRGDHDEAKRLWRIILGSSFPA
ncbi:MAG TPA: hypothetical protein VF054_03345, partial [Micromonosporaceae bacterium]